MGVLLHLNSHVTLISTFTYNSNIQYTAFKSPKNITFSIQYTAFKSPKNITFSRDKIRAIATVSESDTQVESVEEPPSVDCVFVSPVLLPDGTPDVHLRSSCGGQKLRDIMLDSNIDLYGPYARPLLNCGGGGTCGTCLVEVLEGKELLNLRTNKEKETLKRKPKTWRMACQTIVGKPDSRGQLIVQQLPEWKAHEWKKMLVT